MAGPDASGQVADPFAAVLGGGDQKIGPPVAAEGSARAAQDDPFASVMGDAQVDPATSTFGAAARSFGASILPTVGGMAGARLGGLAGTLGGPVGMVAGAAAGSFAGSYAMQGVQNYALSKLPDSWVEALGQDQRQQQIDQEFHPYASFAGGIAPFALTMHPGSGAAAALPANATAAQRLAANPLTARLLGGTMFGGTELGQEAYEGHVDWPKVAIATGVGLIFNRPNRFGEAIEGAIPNMAARAARGFRPEVVPPTVAEGSAAGVAGPGSTEATFLGGEKRDPVADAEAQQTRRDEIATVGPTTSIDPAVKARQVEPDLFATKDRLEADVRALEAHAEPEAVSGQLSAARQELAKVNEQARAAIAGQADRFGTETVEPVPPVAPESGTTVDQKANDAGIAGFKTAKGSTYEVHSDGTTTRNKSDHSEVGHEKTDTGIKERSEKTVYVDAKLASALSAAGLTSPEGTHWRVALKDGKANLVSRQGEGRWGASPESRDVPFTTTPEVGKSPLELWNPRSDVPGHEAYSGMHAGNAITEVSRSVKNLVDQKANIAADVKKQFVAAGRPETEAEDLGSIVANHFVTLASQLNGKLGTAEDMYRREGAEVVAGNQAPTAPAAPQVVIPPAATETPALSAETSRAKANALGVSNLIDSLMQGGATPKEISDFIGKKMSADEIAPLEKPLYQGEKEKLGSYAPGNPRGVLRLFQNANASTAIHELGHDFLERLRRYGVHEAASDQLKADWQTVKKALRGTSDEKPTTRQAHEQFARWFEQYLYEGVAPSKELAGVFGRFKNWLADVYKTVSDIFGRRQVPMNEDVRAVFDRMLAQNPERTVVAEPTPRQPTLTDLHTAEAETAEPHHAEAVADRISSERAETAPPQEVAHEIAAAVQEHEAQRAATDAAREDGAGAERPGEVVGGGGQAGHEPAGGGVGGEPSEVGVGGDEAPTESGGAATAGSGASPGRSVSGGSAKHPPLASLPVDTVAQPKRFVDSAGNIRLDNVNGADDIKQLMREVADANDNFIGNRRGVITDTQVQALSEALGDDRVTRKTLGQAFNAEEAVAVQRIAAQAANDSSMAAKLYAQSQTPDNLLAYAAARERHIMFQGYYAQATAEAGRALRAMRKIQEYWTPGGEAAAGVIKETPDDIAKQATGRTLYQLAEEAKLVAALDSPEAVAATIAGIGKRTAGRLILENWINGLISGPITHLTYTVSNALLSLDKALIETPVAAALGALRPAMGRDADNVVRFGEVGARLRGVGSGFAPAAHAALEAGRTGLAGRLPGNDKVRALPFATAGAPGLSGAMLNEAATMHDVKASLYGGARGILDGMLAIGKIVEASPAGERAIGLEFSPLQVTPNIRIRGGTLPTGTLATLPSRGVSVIHTFFRGTNSSMEKGAESYRKAANEKDENGNNLTGHALAERVAYYRAHPTQEMDEAITKAATDLTLMGPAGEFVKKLQSLINWSPNLPLLGETPILKFIDPFVHIASNIIDQSLVQRTPIGLLSRTLRDELTGKMGVAAQDMAQARMIVGSAMALGFGALASQGYITGSGPQDPNARRVWMQAGNRAHSVRIGDMWYQTNRLGPLGMLLSLSADMYDVGHAAAEGDITHAAALLHMAITHNVLDESFMRGPADLIQAVEDPNRYGERYIKNFASSFLPYSVAFAQMDRAMDPYQRQTRTVLEAIKAKVPGLSETLLPRRDIWGEMLPNSSSLGENATAIYESRVSRDPTEIALAQIGVGISAVPRSIRNVQLTEQQYDDFSRLAGRQLKQRLDVLTRSPDWQRMPVGVRADLVKKYLDTSREAARNLMFMKYPSILAQATRQRREKLIGAQ